MAIWFSVHQGREDPCGDFPFSFFLSTSHARVFPAYSKKTLLSVSEPPPYPSSTSLFSFCLTDFLSIGPPSQTSPQTPTTKPRAAHRCTYERSPNSLLLFLQWTKSGEFPYLPTEKPFHLSINLALPIQLAAAPLVSAPLYLPRLRSYLSTALVRPPYVYPALATAE